MLNLDTYLFKTSHACGRYGLVDTKDLPKRFKAKAIKAAIKPRYNVAPTQDMPVITKKAKSNQIEIMRWGLIMKL